MRPVIYASARSFQPSVSGLARRTQLTFQYFSDSSRTAPKLFLSPKGDMITASTDKAGWTVMEWSTGRAARASAKLRKTEYLRQICDILLCRFSRKSRYRLLSYSGGVDFGWNPWAARMIASCPHALIFLTRADLLPLVQYRQAGQIWVVDTNDSMANLVRVHNHIRKLRRTAGVSHERLVAMHIRSELELADKCDIVIAISPDDLHYFQGTRHPKVILEELCITTPRTSPVRGGALYDVGFIGGDHTGSIKCAESLIQMSGRPGLASLRFGIGGRVCSKLRGSNLPGNLSLVGDLSDCRTFLSTCRCVAILSQGETGTSVKFQEAVLSGVPVIANPAAARWSQAVAGSDYTLIEDLTQCEMLLKKGLPTVHASDGLLRQATEEAFADRMTRAFKESIPEWS